MEHIKTWEKEDRPMKGLFACHTQSQATVPGHAEGEVNDKVSKWLLHYERGAGIAPSTSSQPHPILTDEEKSLSFCDSSPKYVRLDCVH